MAQERVIPSNNTTRKKLSATKERKAKLQEIKTASFFKKMFESMFSEYRKASRAYRSGWSRYKPHQGAQEKVRRLRQLERGIITAFGR